jgi:hypothetical protein
MSNPPWGMGRQLHLGLQVRELLVQMMKHHHPRVEVRGLSPEND